ncbi:SGNH hydrolase domain-containing protein [Streptomyces sp. AK02-04a]|uniref:DUF459 domain-containing protein n=1 Tax=Streptomyces sp. AK02-04a TaxID=3028649 RepID=UPI0029BE03B5|nr:SGNH hydrolase domain-containing protein [Streptomyces sp. AK02-04a]MDX3763394.1 SGNH hydrolase domain-containing protein [Streptomyces sp. AK02-04a]
MSCTFHRPGRVLAAALCLAGLAAAGCSPQQPTRQRTTARAEERAADPAAGDEATSATHSGRATPPLGTAPIHLSRAARGRTILVVGDSWAANLAQGMSAVAPGTTVVNAGLGGCGIRLPAGDDSPPRCRDWLKDWPSYLKKYRPDVTVLMVGYWDVQPQRMTVNEEPKDLTSAPHRADFAAQLDHAVDLLTGSGKTVFLMTSPLIADSPFRDSARAMNQVLREADRRRADVKLLDVAGQLCNDSACPQVIDGIPVYDPTRHLAPKARDRIATWALNTVLTGAEA